jgi:hypothetical protein
MSVLIAPRPLVVEATLMEYVKPTTILWVRWPPMTLREYDRTLSPDNERYS